jgi:peptide-methionine (S)-S-oxide reductase
MAVLAPLTGLSLMLAGLAGARPARLLAAVAARPTRPTAVAVLAGGCYWGVESVYRHVRGVISATSGYATPPAPSGGGAALPAEAVRLVYDPSQISYAQILQVFFSVVHDPTQLDRQGPDVGSEYRSLVFVDSDHQREVVQGYIDSLTAAHVFPRPIVTEITTLHAFHEVDASQQDYAEHHPTDPYIVVNDAPKLEALRKSFPQLYRA